MNIILVKAPSLKLMVTYFSCVFYRIWKRKFSFFFLLWL